MAKALHNGGICRRTGARFFQCRRRSNRCMHHAPMVTTGFGLLLDRPYQLLAWFPQGQWMIAARHDGHTRHCGAWRTSGLLVSKDTASKTERSQITIPYIDRYRIVALGIVDPAAQLPSFAHLQTSVVCLELLTLSWLAITPQSLKFPANDVSVKQSLTFILRPETNQQS